MQNPHSMAGDIDLSRRSFLKLGVAGTVLLGSTSLVANLAGCAKKEEAAAQGYRFLRDADIVLFAALTPVILEGMLPAAQGEREPLITEVLHRIDFACVHLGPPAQKQILQLFDLINMRVTRYLTTGVSAAWPDASAAEIDHFLMRWRESSLGMFNAGYRALIKLVTTSYFGMPAGWAVAGYPGPLAWVYKAVNA